MIQNTSFFDGLIMAIESIGQMGLLVLMGYMMVQRKWLSAGTLTDLTRILIDAVIPSAFILAMARSFTAELFRQGLMLAMVVTVWIIASWAFGSIWFKLLPGGEPARDRSVTAMLMIPNSIYLPLPVILAVTPAEFHDQATMYISIAALPSIAIMWTFGVILLSGASRPSPKERMKLAINAPIISLFIGILLTFVPGIREAARGEPGSIIPLRMVFSVMGYLSQTLSPLAMLILGGFIASSRSAGRFRMRYVLPLIGIRLLIVPAAVYGLIRSGMLGLPALAGTVSTAGRSSAASDEPLSDCTEIRGGMGAGVVAPVSCARGCPSDTTAMAEPWVEFLISTYCYSSISFNSSNRTSSISISHPEAFFETIRSDLDKILMF